NFGICTYYRNEPPFSLDKFCNEIKTDTIFNQAVLGMNSNGAVPAEYFSMPAIAKTNDRSSDLLVTGWLQDTGVNGNPSIWFFRGGPDFGTHRLTLDSAAFVIRHPQFNFGSSPYGDWAVFAPQDAGDMTGTGNHVLLVEARSDDGYSWWDNFYVTGKALDGKIDMWNVATSAGGGDTLTANPDSLEDFLESRSQDDLTNSDPGTMWLYYGTKQIPVRLNPEWASVAGRLQESEAGLSFFPNPTQNSWSVATIVWPVAENTEYEVYNLLGVIVQSGTIRMLGGAEQERIYFSGLASGTYLFVVHGLSFEARSKLMIVR